MSDKLFNFLGCEDKDAEINRLMHQVSKLNVKVENLEKSLQASREVVKALYARWIELAQIKPEDIQAAYIQVCAENNIDPTRIEKCQG